MKPLAWSPLFLGLAAGSVAAQFNPQPGWKDSYAVDGRCYCDTSYDHGLDLKQVVTPVGVKPITEVCADIRRVLGVGPTTGRVPYNDIQCGNGPFNDAADEVGCPGRVDQGAAGCSQRGPRWDLATVYGASTAIQNAEQFDLSGSWYEPETSGQGVLLELYTRQARGSTAPYVFGGWFTYTATMGGPEQQAWFTLEGQTMGDARSFELTIARTAAGRFDTTPAVQPVTVGRAVLSFASCTEALLDYAFNAANGGRIGQIRLRRLLQNVACEDATPRANAPRPFLHSGAWFEPATAGQGLVLELNPAQGALFAAWYTYTGAGAAGHRWYTLQRNGVDAAASAFDAIPILESTGGRFDAAGPPQTRQVGEASVRFLGCTEATLSYRFDAGELQGRSRTIALRRVGPAPVECR